MKHKNSCIVNKVVLRSIPIDRKIKQYWVTKYSRIAYNCGIDEAQRKMKNLRIAIMRYLSSDDRQAILDECLRSSGFRINGQLRALFEQSNCQPHFVLSFLKLYTFDVKSTQTADEAAESTKLRLDSVASRATTPMNMECWFAILGMSHYDRSRYYEMARDSDEKDKVYASRYCKYHTMSDWLSYWHRFHGQLRKGWKSAINADSNKTVFPEVYKDYSVDLQSSKSYNADFGDLVSLNMNEYDCPLSMDQLEFVNGFLHETLQDQLYSVLYGANPVYTGLFKECTFLSGTFVGHVHHIAKKGGGTELRDIAVPNRFVQMALAPGANRLYNVLSMLSQDATYNQDKFDTKIQNRVNNSNLYQGSVDLSKATDNLPYEWGWFIVRSLMNTFGDLPEEEDKSLDLFNSVVKANWEDQGYLIKWKVGQPLGSLPSFAMLGLTHNFFVESLALSLGLGHSPYSILGDDIVIFNKKLRKKYIAEMSRRGVPLSLHKSYEGNLSEFAGKLYIKNCVPFYCSDHSRITWESLFDWQRSTGIRIPWNNLPRKIQNKITSLVRNCVDTSEGKINLRKMASMAYYQAQNGYVFGRGSIQFTHEVNDNLSIFFEYMAASEENPPSATQHTGITLIGDSHPVVLMNYRYADKHGFFQRFRPVVLPTWYKDKIRPCTTDKVITAGLSAHLGYLV